MKKFIILVIVIILVVIVGFYLKQSMSSVEVNPNQDVVTETPPPLNENRLETPVLTEPENKEKTVVGTSVEGRAITAYHYGNGETELLFVGGVHGGYSWNTVLLAYELMDYLKENPSAIPPNVRATVIPVLNPDGLNKVVASDDPTGRFSSSDVATASDKLTAGRFNANEVDLNRNFDCEWQAAGKWQNKTVSGGSQAFSEPESQALKNYVETNRPKAVVAWYSAAGGVFASSCQNSISAETRALTGKYASASGYPAYDSFEAYKVTGDMLNWLAKNNIPAISVLLTNHRDTEWDKNRAGIEALFKNYLQ